MVFLLVTFLPLKTQHFALVTGPKKKNKFGSGNPTLPNFSGET